MSTTGKSIDDIKDVRAESMKLVGQAIIASLIKKEHTMADFNQFFGSTSYYNQSGGNYTQTDGGNYTQNGGGNYTQSPKQSISMIDSIEILSNIRELTAKGLK